MLVFEDKKTAEECANAMNRIFDKAVGIRGVDLCEQLVEIRVAGRRVNLLTKDQFPRGGAGKLVRGRAGKLAEGLENWCVFQGRFVKESTPVFSSRQW
jgi:hypothetical protein